MVKLYSFANSLRAEITISRDKIIHAIHAGNNWLLVNTITEQVISSLSDIGSRTAPIAVSMSYFLAI